MHGASEQQWIGLGLALQHLPGDGQGQLRDFRFGLFVVLPAFVGEFPKAVGDGLAFPRQRLLILLPRPLLAFAQSLLARGLFRLARGLRRETESGGRPRSRCLAR